MTEQECLDTIKESLLRAAKKYIEDVCIEGFNTDEVHISCSREILPLMDEILTKGVAHGKQTDVI